MDELTQRYREIRRLLEQLVAAWPLDRPGTAFENAKVYLDFHCTECGASLSMNDLAVVLELEMLRLGTVDTRRVPYYDPNCIRCYIRRAAPASAPSESPLRSMSPRLVRLLPDTDDATKADICHLERAVTRSQTTKNCSPGDRAGTLLLPETDITAMTISPIARSHVRAWYNAHDSFLVIAAIMIVLLIGMALLVFEPDQHAAGPPMYATPHAIPTKRHGAAMLLRLA